MSYNRCANCGSSRVKIVTQDCFGNIKEQFCSRYCKRIHEAWNELERPAWRYVSVRGGTTYRRK